MNIAAYGQKFFIFGGIILIAVALIQVLTRPRDKGGRPAMRLLDATTMRAIFFVTVGILTLLVGVGVIPMGGGR